MTSELGIAGMPPLGGSGPPAPLPPPPPGQRHAGRGRGGLRSHRGRDQAGLDALHALRRPLPRHHERLHLRHGRAVDGRADRARRRQVAGKVPPRVRKAAPRAQEKPRAGKAAHQEMPRAYPRIIRSIEKSLGLLYSGLTCPKYT